MTNPWYPDYSGSTPYTPLPLPAYLPNRNDRRKQRIIKRRHGFPRGASVHRMTTGTGR